eukprot:CAMPEP_0203744076 /NCGR_PEP_ID=MMETSP0098-20131031/274_1 /ASSEMBLY_ACC=CAM_ASM_000208 /TAXON_ID=96639 /ORGANISM=" , Strain NY0313808BC1" /LENGTH=620 /DNA_ID=CAMNT_0050631503 /DNA_START=113 /DNA_END=1975 /DNA_ORIENTATION=-
MRRAILASRILGAGVGITVATTSIGSPAESEERKRRRTTREPKWDCEVDFLVVGAGSAGCAVSARLAQSFPAKKTLLLEAGDTDDLPEIQTAVDYFGKVGNIFGSDRDHQYYAQGQDELNGRALYWPRGRLVGGCSSFNTMVFMRPPKVDLDAWARGLGKGFEEFNWQGLLPYFKRVETHPGDPVVHGKTGPITVAPLNHSSHCEGGAVHFVTEAFCSAANQALGIPLNTDFAKGTEGVGVNDVNACAGQRCNAAAYLKEVGAYPTGGSSKLSAVSTNPPGALHVWLGSKVERILFDDNNKAVGVVIKLNIPSEDRDEETTDKGRTFDDNEISPRRKRDPSKMKVRVKVKKEIVLSCGAVDSPRLLLLSGIGPREQLEDVGIDVRVDLPGVGQNLKDHLHIPICYRIPSGVKPHSHSNICEGSLFTRLNESARSPDIQLHCGTIFFEPDGFSPLGEGFTLTPSLIYPKSVGSVELESDDPEDKPIINANYLTDPADEDFKQLVKGVRFARKLGQAMLAQLPSGGKEAFPGPDVSTEEDIGDYVRKYVGTMYHPMGTCKIGNDTDKMAVLDKGFKVRGTSNLRVADASSFPDIIGVNTNATCIALGEKAAQVIIDDHIGNS